MAKKEEQKKVQLEDAFILSKELGMKIVDILNEMPIKYTNLITPILQEIVKSPRGTIDINPPEETKSVSAE